MRELSSEQEPLRTKPYRTSSLPVPFLPLWTSVIGSFPQPRESGNPPRKKYLVLDTHSPLILLLFTRSPWPCNPPNCKWEELFVQVQALVGMSLALALTVSYILGTGKCLEYLGAN